MLTLTKPELSRRTALERTIKQTKGAFVACGKALAEIRDAKLYRCTHGTFEEYCYEVWNWTTRRAYQIIDAADVVASLPEKCEPRFTNERQVRELGKVPEDKREAVLEDASKNGHLTARKIAVSAAEADEPEELTDEVGREIPKDLRDDWHGAQLVGKEIRAAGRVFKAVVDRHLANGDKYRQRHNLSEQMSKDIGALVYALSAAIPYALCPFCQGLGKRCEKCHGRGWVSKSYWTSFVPEKLKKMIVK